MDANIQNCLYFLKLEPMLKAIGIPKKERSNIITRRRYGTPTPRDLALIANALKAAGIDELLRYADGVTLPPVTVTTREVEP
jgi:hypothetical protein